MRDHKDDFIPFLAGVDGEDMPGATDDGIMTESQFEEYTHRVENTAEWGGEPEVSSTRRRSLTGRLRLFLARSTSLSMSFSGDRLLLCLMVGRATHLVELLHPRTV